MPPSITAHQVTTAPDGTVNVSFDRSPDTKSTACVLTRDGKTVMERRYEQTPPLLALGDAGLKLKPGDYTLWLVAYTGEGGAGDKGKDYVVRFTVPVAPVVAPVGKPPAQAPSTGDAGKLAARVAELERENADLKKKLAEPIVVEFNPDGIKVTAGGKPASGFQFKRPG